MDTPGGPLVAKYEEGWGRPQREAGRLRAAIMCRISREEDNNTSIATMEDDGRTFCRLRGYDVVLVTYDVGVSGSVKPENRPGFSVILDNLPHIDVVVSRSVDRFTRVTAHFASLVERLDKGGTTLVDVQGQVDLTSPYGRFVTTIMVAFAQMEREMIQGRILRSRAALRTAGRWLGGAAPYGYRIVPDGTGGKRLEIDPEPADNLQEVIRRVVSGVTLTSEVERLNATGVLSPADYRKALRGELPPAAPGYSQWTYSPLWQHLRSEVLRGVRVVGKRTERRAVRDESGEAVRVGPALVSDEVWRQLQRALDAAAVDPRRPRRKATLLLHVAWCPRCDETLYYNSREYAGRRLDLYTCSAARSTSVRAQGKCPGISVNAVRLEALVEDWLLTTMGRMPFLQQKRVGGSSTADEAAEVAADIDELAASLVGLRGAAKDAVLSQLTARQEVLEELQAQPAEPERVEWVPTGRTVAEEWEARDTAERRLLLLDLSIRAEVAPANGRRTWDPSRIDVGFFREDPEADELEEALLQAMD